MSSISTSYDTMPLDLVRIILQMKREMNQAFLRELRTEIASRPSLIWNRVVCCERDYYGKYWVCVTQNQN